MIALIGMPIRHRPGGTSLRASSSDYWLWETSDCRYEVPSVMKACKSEDD